MAVPTVRATPSSGVGNGVTSVDIPQPSGLSDGDVVFLLLDWEDWDPGTVVLPSGFTGAYMTNSTDHRMPIYRAWKHVTSAAGEPANYTVSWDNTRKVNYLGAASPDCDTSDPFDVEGVTDDGTNDTAAVLGGVTTTVDDCLLFLWYVSETANRTISSGPGTLLAQASQGGAGADVATEWRTDSQASAGSTGSKDATWSGNVQGTNAIIAIAPPAGGGGTTVTPGVIATTTAIPTPTPTGAAAVSPAEIATTSALPGPDPQGQGAAAPNEVPTTSTVPTPDKSIGKTVTPDEVSTSATVPTPTPLGAALSTPDEVATVSTVPQPGTSIGKTVAPGVITTVAAVPTPTPLGAALVTVSVINTSSTVPTPTPVVPAVTVTPDEIATVSTVPTPTPSIPGVAAPTVILTTVTLPTPAPAVPGSASPNAIATVSALSTPTPVGGTAVSPDVIATLVDVLIPLASGDAIVIAAESWVQFQRIGSTLVLAEIGRGGRTGHRLAEGFERVSEVFAVDNTDGSQGHRDAAMVAVASAWAVNSGASAATLKAAIDLALQAAGFRDPAGNDLT